MEEYVKCFGCGSNSLNIEGETHAYMLSAPGCWVMFCEVMEREYSNLMYAKAHHYTVDAFAAQHVGDKKDSRAINSVIIHLASLCMLFEHNLNISEVVDFKIKFSQHYKGSGILQWLEPPVSFGDLTIHELWENDKPELHFSLAEKWAKSVWRSWSHQHKTIEELIRNV